MAADLFQKAIDITPKMAAQLIQVLKRENVQFVVAPYEADSQLVYLEKSGFITGIISEDSDLLIFGAKVLFTKMNEFGECIRVSRDNFFKCKDLSLAGMNDAQLRAMAIFSGCDYSNGIPKVGLKIAHRYIRKYMTAERALRGLRFNGFNVPKDFEQIFEQAELTFLHQRVFCLKERKLIMLNESKTELSQEVHEFIGRLVDPKIAEGVAMGILDPFTKEPIVLNKAESMMVATSSASMPLTPPITSFFSKAEHTRSVPTSTNRFSIPQNNTTASIPRARTLPQPYFSLTKQEEVSAYNRSLVAKRAVTVFETEQKKIEYTPTTKDFESRFFASIKKPSSKKQLETSHDVEDDQPRLKRHKPNMDLVVTEISASKINLSQFAYQNSTPKIEIPSSSPLASPLKKPDSRPPLESPVESSFEEIIHSSEEEIPETPVKQRGTAKNKSLVYHKSPSKEYLKTDQVGLKLKNLKGHENAIKELPTKYKAIKSLSDKENTDSSILGSLQKFRYKG